MTGSPYPIGHNTAGSGATQTISVTTASGAGDALLVGTGNSSAGGAVITGIADSSGNSWSRLITAAVATNEFGDLWGALPQANDGTTVPVTTDIVVTWSTTSGEKACLAIGVPGVATSSALDQQNTAHGTGESPTVSTGALAQANEIAIGLLCNQDTAAPGSLSLTEVGQYQAGTSPYVTFCSEATPSTADVTLSAAFGASANWAAIIVTLRLASAGSGMLMAAGII